MSASSLLADLVSGRAVWMPVEGGSMYPTILDTDRVRVEPVDPTTLRPGDVVFVVTGERFVLHRLWRLDDAGNAILRGDAMRAFDTPVAVARILGRATHVQRRNGLRAPLRKRWPVRLQWTYCLWTGRVRRRLVRLLGR